MRFEGPVNVVDEHSPARILLQHGGGVDRYDAAGQVVAEAGGAVDQDHVPCRAPDGGRQRRRGPAEGDAVQVLGVLGDERAVIVRDDFHLIAGREFRFDPRGPIRAVLDEEREAPGVQFGPQGRVIAAAEHEQLTTAPAGEFLGDGGILGDRHLLRVVRHQGGDASCGVHARFYP